MKRKVRNRLILAAVLLGLGAFFVLTLRPTPVPVETAPVVRGDFVETVEEEGRTRARERYVVSAPVTGRLRRIDLHPGDPVQEDQVLAELTAARPALLDPRTREEIEARVAAARAGHRTALARVEQARRRTDLLEAEVSRLDALVEAGAAATQALDQARAERDAARHEVEAARFAARMAAYEIRQGEAALRQVDAEADGAGPCCTVPSPVEGEVLRVLQESEGVVAVGTPLLEVGDVGALEVVVDVLTQDAPRIRPGAPAALTGWGGAELKARVRRVEPAGRTVVSALGVEEQRVDVVLDLDGEAEARAGLGDGFRVEAAIEIRRVPGAVVVPMGALFRQGEGWAVYTVAGGRAGLRPVTLGPRNAEEAVVEEGLEEGEAVVLYPSEKVEDGGKVEVLR